MKINVRHDRLIVISDLHLGNPFCKIKQELIDLLRFYCDKGYDLCINGDGIDIAQTSFLAISKATPAVFRELNRYKYKGQVVYYVVGNHDIILENFMGEWGAIEVVPFLNVSSGDQRVKIDHGHLYDPDFINRPVLYELITMIAKPFLFFSPNLYNLWIFFEKIRFSRRAYTKTVDAENSIMGENQVFSKYAEYLMKRGFDTVIFGHTHKKGTVKFDGNKTYMNPGSWMNGTSYVKIDNGECVLKTWLS